VAEILYGIDYEPVALTLASMFQAQYFNPQKSVVGVGDIEEPVEDDIDSPYYNKIRYLYPTEQPFFGTKVLTIFIFTKNSIMNLNDPELEEIIELINTWPEFHVHIYFDWSLASQVQETLGQVPDISQVDPGSGWYTQHDWMRDIEEKEGLVIAMCEALAEYGWVYKGRISEASVSAFDGDIRSFYAGQL
jgi:hypothetical protein